MAEPGARIVPGDTPQVPVPEEQPDCSAVYQVLVLFPELSFT